VNSEFVEWLKRSIVCTSHEPRDIQTLSSVGSLRLKIYSISKFKFLLTFSNEEQMEEVLPNHQELNQWFVEFQRWNKYEHCETRRVWLEIFGIPPHGWK